jgi:hypothetical protein
MNEVWKDIPGYEGLYQVSNLGRVKSLERFKDNNGGLVRVPEKIMTGGKRHGYILMFLSKEGSRKTFAAHRLVAQVFIPNPENKPSVNHINGNKQDNRVCNLEWNTYKENTNHAIKTGLWDHKNNKTSIPVIQYDTDMNVIKTYPSMMEAERQTGIPNRNIAMCCRGKFKRIGGYIWKYA